VLRHARRGFCRGVGGRRLWIWFWLPWCSFLLNCSSLRPASQRLGFLFESAMVRGLITIDLCSGPASFVVTGEAAAEDFEKRFEIALCVWSIDDGERAGAEGGGELTHVVAGGAVSLDDHDGWW